MEDITLLGDGRPDLPSFSASAPLGLVHSTRIGDAWMLHDEPDEQLVVLDTRDLTQLYLTRDDLQSMLAELDAHAA
jgi:hypothetical protein